MRTFTRGLAAIATATAVALAPMSIANAQSSLLSSSSETAPPVNQNPTPTPNPTPEPPVEHPTNLTPSEQSLYNVLRDSVEARKNVITPEGQAKAQEWTQKAINGQVYFSPQEPLKDVYDASGGGIVYRVPEGQLDILLGVIQSSTQGIFGGEAGIHVASHGGYVYAAQFYIF